MEGYRAKKANPKYEFLVGGGLPFAFAGLWSGWTNPADNTELHSFTIITTDPNFLLEQYHNRMPVILKPSEYARWLSGDGVPIDLLRPLNPEAMTATCVDPGTAVTAKEATLFDSLETLRTSDSGARSIQDAARRELEGSS